MTDCQTCHDYLEHNRRRLLPHVGRTVVATGRTPEQIYADLAQRFHKLGHPTTPHPEPSEATKALRRIAKTRRPA